MSSEKSPDELTAESLELTRALAELSGWSAERKLVLSAVERYIQRSLLSGKMTARRKHESGREYLTDRMIATLQLECSQLRRSLLMMHVRERQMRARLAELAEHSQDEAKSA